VANSLRGQPDTNRGKKQCSPKGVLEQKKKRKKKKKGNSGGSSWAVQNDEKKMRKNRKGLRDSEKNTSKETKWAKKPAKESEVTMPGNCRTRFERRRDEREKRGQESTPYGPKRKHKKKGTVGKTKRVPGGGREPSKWREDGGKGERVLSCKVLRRKRMREVSVQRIWNSQAAEKRKEKFEQKIPKEGVCSRGSVQEAKENGSRTSLEGLENGGGSGWPKRMNNERLGGGKHGSFI